MDQGQATFSVSAEGGSDTEYQWMVNGQIIQGATAASYTTPPATAAMENWSYTVVVSDALGSVTSNPALLTVDEPPAITTPPAPITASMGSEATFTVVATGTPDPTYQWQLNGTDIAGATSDYYTVPATTLAMNGESYTVTVTNKVSHVTSAPAILNVGIAPAIITQPASATLVSPATSVTFSVVASGTPPPSYQWTLNGNNIPGAASAAYTVTAPANNGDQYAVVVQNGVGSPVQSQSATLTVDQAPVFQTTPANIIVDSGAPSVTFTASASGNPPPSLQWYRNGNATNVTSNSYTVANPTYLNDGDVYKVVISNGVGTPVSASATLTVNYAPMFTPQPSNQINVVNGSPLNLNCQLQGEPAPSLQWFFVSGPGAQPQPVGTGTTTLTINPIASTNAGSYYLAASNSISTVNSSTFNVTVLPTYPVSGSVVVNNANAQQSLQVTLNSVPPQTVTTGSNGSYAFPTPVTAGTYILTPSYAGASSAFQPPSVPVIVPTPNGNPSTFQLAGQGYSVTGPVSYGGTHTGTIYVILQGQNGEGTFGTSLGAPGTFTVRGLPAGTYNLSGYMDIMGGGGNNANDPSSGSVTQTVPLAPGSPLSVVLPNPLPLADPPAGNGNLGGNPGPGNLQVFPVDSGAILTFDAILQNGLDQSQSYTVEWSESPRFAELTGRTFVNSAGQVIFLGPDAGLVNGLSYYFRISAEGGGTVSDYTYYPATLANPVLIGAGAGGNTVSGTINLPLLGASYGPLYVAAFDVSNGQIYAQVIASPTASQTYSISGVPSGASVGMIGILDQNGDGQLDMGDFSNANDPGIARFLVSGNLQNVNLTLPTNNSFAQVRTNQSQTAPPTNTTYSLNFVIQDGVKHVTAVTLDTLATAGPLVSALGPYLPADLGRSGGQQQFMNGFNSGSTPPSLGDSYGFLVTYSDGTTDNLNAPVTGIVPYSFTGLNTPTPPPITPLTFMWSPLALQPGYTAQFFLTNSSGDTIWRVPAANSLADVLDPSSGSLTFGVDPQDPNNVPTGQLISGAPYTWSLNVYDAQNNQSSTTASFTAP
jgi:hypothetical protein